MGALRSTTCALAGAAPTRARHACCLSGLHLRLGTSAHLWEGEPGGFRAVQCGEAVPEQWPLTPPTSLVHEHPRLHARHPHRKVPGTSVVELHATWPKPPQTPTGTAETSAKGTTVSEGSLLEEGSPPEITTSLAATSCQSAAGRKHQASWKLNEYPILWKTSSISGQITREK